MKTGERNKENRGVISVAESICLRPNLVNEGQQITQEIYDEAAVAESSGWFFKVNLPVWRVEEVSNPGNKVARVGIRIAKVENCWEIEVNGIGKMEEERT